MLLGELRFCAKFPFSSQARALLQKQSISLDKVSDELLACSAARIESALKRADLSAKLNEITASQESFLLNELLSFPISKMLAALAKDNYLLATVARAEAERAKYFLKFENNDVALELAGQFFKSGRSETGFSVSLIDFLRLLPKGAKLLDQDARGGTVAVGRELLDGMVGETVFQSILSTRVDETSVPKMFTFWAEEVKKHRRAGFEDTGAQYGDFDASCAPPCIRKIIVDLQSSEKVGHMPRFALATFCASTGVPIETVVDFFRRQPNWNEQKTRYHLEHAYGSKGRTKYSCPNCVKMESLGLCYRDETCRWPNPALYYKRVRARKEKEAIARNERFDLEKGLGKGEAVK
ncbi:hypothetical protein HY546_00065 [archaeon]|nr:hypothetical protein [archaeon]